MVKGAAASASSAMGTAAGPRSYALPDLFQLTTHLRMTEVVKGAAASAFRNGDGGGA